MNGDSKVGIRFDLSNADVIDFVRNYDFAWARRQIVFDVETFRGLLIKAETGSLRDLTRAIQREFKLDLGIADLLAQTESLRAANAGALASYRKAGIEAVRWMADLPARCQYCRALNNKQVAAGAPFLQPGEFSARRNGKPMIVFDPVCLPPLHFGCTCTIRAVV